MYGIRAMPNVQWFTRPQLNQEIWHHIKKVDVVLDIGCGIRPQGFMKPDLHICYDPCEEYINVAQKIFERKTNMMFLKGDAKVAIGAIGENSVDSVFFLDVVEHINKPEAIELLQRCKSLARSQIVVFTPLGFYKRDYGNNERDGWGLKGGKWETHISAWSPNDFDDSWEILACKKYHFIDKNGGILNPPVGAFWAIWNRPISYNGRVYCNPSVTVKVAGGLWDNLVVKGIPLANTLPASIHRGLINGAIKAFVRAGNIRRKLS